MTPFDPWVLLAMLQAFYPIVSPAALAQARRDRPTYFAGGTLIGHSGDKMQLPDGRIWDLILAVDGPVSGRRWIAIDVTTNGPGVDDPFALEAGPLTPLDEGAEYFPPSGATFEPLVAARLGELGGTDDRLAAAGAAVLEVDGAGDVDRSYAELVEPALRAHVGTRAALDMDDPADIIQATNNHDGEIDGGTRDYDEPLPPDDPEPDPGDPPDRGRDDEKEPKEY